MRDVPRIIVRPIPSISEEEARDARARAWSYVLSCYAGREAAAEHEDRDDVDGRPNLRPVEGGGA